VDDLFRDSGRPTVEHRLSQPPVNAIVVGDLGKFPKWRLSTMNEWVAWVEVPARRWHDGAGRIQTRYYVTHGIPFLQLTPFRSAAARYTTKRVAEEVAAMAAHPFWPRGAEVVPRSLVAPPPDRDTSGPDVPARDTSAPSKAAEG
jgi:hypothetical protein